MSDRYRKILCVGWDADRVIYPGLSTSICAEKSTLDPEPYVNEFILRKWFTEDDVNRWCEEYNEGKGIASVGDVARMLTDFMYKMGIISKQQTIEGKQAILRGLTMKDIRKISEEIEYNPGLREAVETFRKEGLYQTLFSDGLGPHITYQRRKLGMDAGKGISPLIMLPGNEVVLYEDWHLAIDQATLTGSIEKMDKAKEFFKHVSKLGIPLSSVAVIDDSGSNVESLLLPVQREGGIAVGYNPTDAHRPKFEKASIPILKETNLEAFAEIVLNPKKIGRYCE